MSDLNTEKPNNNLELGKYEQHKQKKASQEAEGLRARRFKVFKKITYWIMGVAVVLGGGWFLINTSGPQTTDFSQEVTVLDRNHVANGTSVSYNSNPPTSGSHYAAPASVGFYDKELPDEQLVHNLEHGHVWVAYKLGLADEVIKELKGLAGGYVIVTPRSQNDTDLALVAWGRLDKFNLENGNFDQQRLRDFISRYQNKGPEKIGGATGRLR